MNNIPNANQNPTQPIGYQRPVQPTGYQNTAQPTGYQNPAPPKKRINKKKINKKSIIVISAIIAAVLLISTIVVFIYVNSKPSFNIEKVVENIKVDGNPYKWPSSLNDLGTNWDWHQFGQPMTIDGDTMAIATYNGDPVFSCGLYNYTGDDGKDNLIHTIFISDISESLVNVVSIDGLMLGDPKQAVLDKYGEPTSVESSGASEVLLYTVEKDKKELAVSILDGKISTIMLTCFPE